MATVRFLQASVNIIILHVHGVSLQTTEIFTKGSSSGIYYNKIKFAESKSTFRGNISPPSSGLETKPSKKPGVQAASRGPLKVEAFRFFVTSVAFNWCI
jgi:hypothetical protein